MDINYLTDIGDFLRYGKSCPSVGNFSNITSLATPSSPFSQCYYSRTPNIRMLDFLEGPSHFHMFFLFHFPALCLFVLLFRESPQFQSSVGLKKCWQSFLIFRSFFVFLASLNVTF